LSKKQITEERFYNIDEAIRPWASTTTEILKHLAGSETWPKRSNHSESVTVELPEDLLLLVVQSSQTCTSLYLDAFKPDDLKSQREEVFRLSGPAVDIAYRRKIPIINEDVVATIVVPPELKLSTHKDGQTLELVTREDGTAGLEIDVATQSRSPLVIVSLSPENSSRQPSSPRNTHVLPLFPADVPAGNEEDAFTWGANTKNLANPELSEGSKLLEAYFAPFDACMPDERKTEAEIVIDVMGLASSSWNGRIDPEFNDENLALAEGRRIAFLLLFNQFTTESNPRIFVRNFDRNRNERLTPLEDFAADAKTWSWDSSGGLMPAGSQRFDSYREIY